MTTSNRFLRYGLLGLCVTLTLLGLAVQFDLLPAWLHFVSGPEGLTLADGGGTAVVVSQIMKQLDGLDSTMKSRVQAAVTEQCAELADRIQQLEQKGFAGAAGGSEFKPRTSWIGRDVEEQFRKNEDLYGKTKQISLSVKANPGNWAAQIGNRTSVAGVPGPVQPAFDLFSQLPTRPMQGTATANYIRKIGITMIANPSGGQPGVAPQAEEGALKGETRPIFENVSQNPITIAGWCPASEQSLRTVGELEAVIDVHLRTEILKKADDVLLSGTTAVGWPFSGLYPLAATYESAVYTTMADTVVEVAAHMRWAGYNPSHIVLNPMTYLAVVLAKATTGEYLTGQYMGDVPLVMHGMTVCFSSEIPQGRALLVDRAYVEHGIGDTLNVTIGTTGDQFIRNMVTIRGEMSFIPLLRDKNAIMIAKPKP